MTPTPEERKAWLQGWDAGLKFGRNQGRSALRLKLRAVLRKSGAAALVAEITNRPRKKR